MPNQLIFQFNVSCSSFSSSVVNWSNVDTARTRWRASTQRNKHEIELIIQETDEIAYLATGQELNNYVFQILKINFVHYDAISLSPVENASSDELEILWPGVVVGWDSLSVDICALRSSFCTVFSSQSNADSVFLLSRQKIG